MPGGFTLPSEAGHEDLALAMARAWGADVVRDSNGTSLSPRLLDSGLDVYATLCLVREDREWALAHPECLQQNVLMSDPVTATGPSTRVDLLAGFSKDQFRVAGADGEEFWQVHDRTAGAELPAARWRRDGDGHVVVEGTEPGHRYTVNFLAVRLWEEISMYNHVTNGWGDAPRLVAVDPRHPAAAAHLLEWLEEWCRANPEVDVVRFTSLFYNFAWFWGDDPAHPYRYSDWGSYDFTVSAAALRAFHEATGARITAEDFVRAGRYTSTHNPPSALYLRWIEFVGGFVRDLGRRCVDVVHAHGKRALVFYDDSWIGVEPHSGRFGEFGFDGIIKAVFSAFEARLCAAVPTATHEVRLHPYLFPVDLEGRPTFAPGGDPTADLLRYWRQVRRGMLRDRIDRIGLGGYLSLVAGFPDFQRAVAGVADEHRTLLGLHRAGGPAAEPLTVGVLTCWGPLRTWSTSGHLHENPRLCLAHALEALAGLPVRVRFLRLSDVAATGVPEGVDVLLNAGPAGTAWSGGGIWRDPALVAGVRRWVAAGGGLVGIEDHSAADHGTGTLQLADVLGVDRDTGDRHCVVHRAVEVVPDHPLLAHGATAPAAAPGGLFVARAGVEVAAARDGAPVAAATGHGEGHAVYLSGLGAGPGQVRLLANALAAAAGRPWSLPWAERPEVDVAVFPGAGGDVVVLANSSDAPVATVLHGTGDAVPVELGAGELRVLRRG